MSQTTLRERLEAHAAACRAALDSETARPELPAELRDLRGADLRGANLAGANITGTYLCGVPGVKTLGALHYAAYRIGPQLAYGCECWPIVEWPVAEARARHPEALDAAHAEVAALVARLQGEVVRP